jgi:hypothetical protein
MEFSMSRGTQAPAPARVAANGGSSASSNGNGKKSAHWSNSPQWLRIVWMVLLFGATLIAVGVVLLLYFGGAKEQNFVDKSKEQAVFLTNGQVYFGKIKSINKDYINLQSIYYLNVNQQVQPNQSSSSSNSNSSNSNQSVSLVKLGCELHGPTDQMIVNRTQVTFWENLKTDGQVSKAIATWVQQNPNGQTCSTASSNNSSSNSSSSNSTSKP